MAIAYDETKHPQKMWIMNIVWPVTALFASLLALRGYFKYGRAADGGHTEGKASRSDTPFSVAVAKGATHCGAGFTIGDILAEWLAFTFPAVAVWFGWRSLFQEKLLSVWVLAYAFAFVLGIAFQYFTIKPMRQLSAGRGLVEALRLQLCPPVNCQCGGLTRGESAQCEKRERTMTTGTGRPAGPLTAMARSADSAPKVLRVRSTHMAGDRNRSCAHGHLVEEIERGNLYIEVERPEEGERLQLVTRQRGYGDRRPDAGELPQALDQGQAPRDSRFALVRL